MKNKKRNMVLWPFFNTRIYTKKRVFLNGYDAYAGRVRV